MEFKPFQMDEFNAIAARSEAEAIEWYKRESGCTDEDIAGMYEIPLSALTWDYIDPFKTGAKRYTKLKQRTLKAKAPCDIDGRLYTIIRGDLFVEITYADLLKKLDPKEPMLITMGI